MPRLDRLLPLIIGFTLLAALGEVALEQAGDRLAAQLESYRELSNFMARHPRVIELLEGQSGRAEISEFLLRSALIAGAKSIYVLDATGRVRASSTLEEEPDFIGRALGQRRDVRAAMTGRLGVYHSAERDGARGYYFTRGVLGEASKAQGFVVVKVNMDELEYEWRIDENVVTFFDAYGVVFVSNRLDLALTAEPDLARRTQTSSEPYDPGSLRPASPAATRSCNRCKTTWFRRPS